MGISFEMPEYNRGTTPEQLDIVNSISYGLDDELGEVIREVTKPNVPIYELKAEEEARAKLKNHKEDSNYEELVAAVKEMESFMADKDELHHRALAVLLDNDILFDELKRAQQALDTTLSTVDKEPNPWEKHGSMYEELQNDMHKSVDRHATLLEMLTKLM